MLFRSKRPGVKLPHEIAIIERIDSGLPPLAEVVMFEVSDEETVEGVAALSEEPAVDAEDVVDSVVEKMAGIEDQTQEEE